MFDCYRELVDVALCKAPLQNILIFSSAFGDGIRTMRMAAKG
jgi:hypothetical protein